ncbi:MAG: bile acid:sodium symporter, partial [Proteobacteria bacterium]|nr:bile acid:sodium symporter [Pseudomonadota bacterium]
FLTGIVLVFLLVILDKTATLARAGIFLKNHNGSSVMIFFIFLFSGFIIEPDQIKAGIKDVKATAITLVVIVLAAPVAAYLLSFIPLETGVILGLFIVAAMPTTLSSGVVMTGQAGGNMAHALFVTILSNCVSIVSIPVILPLLLLSLKLKTELFIDQKAIFIKLILLVLLPLVAGLFLKKTVLPITMARKKQLGIINQLIIICVVYMSLSGARQILIAKSATFWEILPLVAGFHLILLGICFGLSRFLDIGRGRREAILFMGSQKTLALSVMIQITCFPEYGTALLVCVMHHILHLMIDGYLAARMGEKG